MRLESKFTTMIASKFAKKMVRDKLGYDVDIRLNRLRTTVMEDKMHVELNVDLDKYTRAFDIIDVMYQSLRTVLNVKSTYQTVSDRISDYKNLLEDFNDKVIKRKHIELADTMLISINKKAIDNIYNEGSQLYHSVNDLVLYATGAAACSTSDLLMVLDNINNSLDLIEKHLNQAYFQTWRYVQLRMGYWKEKVYRTRTKEEILEDAFSRWKVAGKLDY